METFLFLAIKAQLENLTNAKGERIFKFVGLYDEEFEQEQGDLPLPMAMVNLDNIAYFEEGSGDHHQVANANIEILVGSQRPIVEGIASKSTVDKWKRDGIEHLQLLQETARALHGFEAAEEDTPERDGQYFIGPFRRRTVNVEERFQRVKFHRIGFEGRVVDASLDTRQRITITFNTAAEIIVD